MEPKTYPTVFTKDEGKCNVSPLVEGPCFTTTALGEVELLITDVLFLLQQAQISGTFDAVTDPQGITDGVIQGFMSESQASSITIDLGGGDAPLKVYDLVKENPLETLEDGTTGWSFLLRFGATRAELIPAP